MAAAVGLSVLAGWAFHVPQLLTWVPGQVTLKANTAVGFSFAALVLVCRARDRGRGWATGLGDAGAYFMLALGVLTLLEYATDQSFGIDELLVRDTLVAPGSGTSHPGRLAPISASAFVLAGASLRWIRSASPFVQRAAQACTFGVLLLALVSLAGYLYGAHVLVGLFALTRMAIHTIVGFVAIGIGTLFLRPDVGWMGDVTGHGPGAVIARRLLPAALIVPLAVGLTCLRGYRAGIYDTAFAAALMSVAETVSFAALVWLSARYLNETERARSLASVDELTGLLNRRAFLAQSSERLAAARRSGASALLFFIDLDGMKGINDGLGHAAGDRALVETAGALQTSFRDGDLIGRLGGDEFVVLATRASIEHAPIMSARLMAKIARLNEAPDRAFELKLTAGVTAIGPEETASLLDLLKRADAEMYERKQAKTGARGARVARDGRVLSGTPRGA